MTTRSRGGLERALLGHPSITPALGARRTHGTLAVEVRVADLVAEAYLGRVQLSATGFYATPDIHYDREKGRGRPFYYFTWGAAITEVEVDGFTGMYAIRRVDILHDVGDSLIGSMTFNGPDGFTQPVRYGKTSRR